MVTCRLSVFSQWHTVATLANKTTSRPLRSFSSTSSKSSPSIELAWESIGNDRASTSSSPNDTSSTVFLHGLLGHGRNLRTFAKQVCNIQQNSGVLIDLRGHGKSRLTAEQLNYPHSFDACVGDLQYTLEKLSLESQISSKEITLVGHSWGGRMALQLAAKSLDNNNNNNNNNDATTLAHSIPSIQRVWLLDTVPGLANESVERVVGTVGTLSTRFTTSPIVDKKELITTLTNEFGVDMGTAAWLASSYDPQTGDFGFDFNVVQGILPEFGTQDFDGMLSSLLEQSVRVDLVRGGKNTAWDIPILRRLEALKKDYPNHFGLHVLPKAGHWVHVDDLKGLVALFGTPP